MLTETSVSTSFQTNIIVSPEALEACPGWTWAVKEDKWQAGYALLQVYVRREGDALVPASHIENDDNLGFFVQKQRSRHRTGTLSAERIALRESVPGRHWKVGRGRRRPS